MQKKFRDRDSDVHVHVMNFKLSSIKIDNRSFSENSFRNVLACFKACLHYAIHIGCNEFGGKLETEKEFDMVPR